MGQKLDFCGKRYLIGAYSKLDGDTLYTTMPKAEYSFILFLEGGVHVLPTMSIFRSAFVLWRPWDSYPSMSAPAKPFNIPPNSLAVSQPSKAKNLPPTACLSKFSRALLRSLRFSRKVIGTTEAKAPQPYQFHSIPPSRHLPSSLYPFRLRRGP